MNFFALSQSRIFFILGHGGEDRMGILINNSAMTIKFALISLSHLPLAPTGADVALSRTLFDPCDSEASAAPIPYLESELGESVSLVFYLLWRGGLKRELFRINILCDASHKGASGSFVSDVWMMEKHLISCVWAWWIKISIFFNFRNKEMENKILIFMSELNVKKPSRLNFMEIENIRFSLRYGAAYCNMERWTWNDLQAFIGSLFRWSELESDFSCEIFERLKV